MRSVLHPYRRHLDACPHRPKGRRWTRCACPIWVDGYVNGARYHKTLRTSDWPDGLSQVAALMRGDKPLARSIDDAISAWKMSLEVEPSTRRKYERLADQFAAWCAGRSEIRSLGDLTVELLGDFRASRTLSRSTSIRELHTCRQMFGFWQSRGWIKNNPATLIKPPKGARRQVLPFSEDEMARILEATGHLGQTVAMGEDRAYVRLRARALVTVMRYTGLAIGDAVMLRRDAIQPDGFLVVHRQKTSQPVRLRVPEVLLSTLASLPAPRSIAGDTAVSSSDSQSRHGLPIASAGVQSGYFFWNGRITRRALVGIAERIMAGIKRISKVPDFHSHRFRHTLACSMLAKGASLEEVAHALGNTAKVVHDHYAPWVAARQDRLDELMQRVNEPKADKPERVM